MPNHCTYKNCPKYLVCSVKIEPGCVPVCKPVENRELVNIAAQILTLLYIAE